MADNRTPPHPLFRHFWRLECRHSSYTARLLEGMFAPVQTNEQVLLAHAFPDDSSLTFTSQSLVVRVPGLQLELPAVTWDTPLAELARRPAAAPDSTLELHPETPGQPWVIVHREGERCWLRVELSAPLPLVIDVALDPRAPLWALVDAWLAHRAAWLRRGA